MDNNTLCQLKYTNQPICNPNINTTWYQGNNKLITWSIYSPLYSNYKSLNLYFYYRKNYQYFSTINFTNIGINKGYYSILIDYNWFPTNCTENDITWDYTVLLLGNGMNPNNELNNTLSEWVPVNFNLIQNKSNVPCLNIDNQTSITNNSTSNIIPSNYKSNKMDIWKIIVIVISLLIFILICLLFIKIKFYKKVKK